MGVNTLGEEERLQRWKRQHIVEQKMLYFIPVAIVTCEKKDYVPSSLAQHLAHIFRALRMDCPRRKESDIAAVLKASRRRVDHGFDPLLPESIAKRLGLGIHRWMANNFLVGLKWRAREIQSDVTMVLESKEGVAALDHVRWRRFHIVPPAEAVERDFGQAGRYVQGRVQNPVLVSLAEA